MNAVLQPRTGFRPMQLDDLDQIMEIEPQIYSHPWSRGNFSDSLNAGYSCWVYELEGQFIGYAVMMMVLDEAHVLNISIARGYQGRGLGRALMQKLIDVARSRGAQTMFLEVRPSNLAARALYDSMGFNDFSVRKGYYPAKHGREDAILMGMAI
jgi:[ribosomal protein S18]-alanine N-acetyltransferase